jgi:hypothetical protein
MVGNASSKWSISLDKLLALCYTYGKKRRGGSGMATPYDDTLKIFVSENAQDFISWLVKGA